MCAAPRGGRAGPRALQPLQPGLRVRRRGRAAALPALGLRVHQAPPRGRSSRAPRRRRRKHREGHSAVVRGLRRRVRPPCCPEQDAGPVHHLRRRRRHGGPGRRRRDGGPADGGGGGARALGHQLPAAPEARGGQRLGARGLPRAAGGPRRTAGGGAPRVLRGFCRGRGRDAPLRRGRPARPEAREGGGAQRRGRCGERCVSKPRRRGIGHLLAEA
mmetsp:Transcript_56763/g.160157  ORF Transcript_56763/g.160157 Transcript_56763/m.160157 type:complete len:216 (+) Transcript_56763:293-940(+)